jgi:hypothetical protein
MCIFGAWKFDIYKIICGCNAKVFREFYEKNISKNSIKHNFFILVEKFVFGGKFRVMLWGKPFPLKVLAFDRA